MLVCPAFCSSESDSLFVTCTQLSAVLAGAAATLCLLEVKAVTVVHVKSRTALEQVL